MARTNSSTITSIFAGSFLTSFLCCLACGICYPVFLYLALVYAGVSKQTALLVVIGYVIITGIVNLVMLYVPPPGRE